MTTWDWKYRIYFDSAVLSEVEEWMGQLNTEEKAVYSKIVGFYTSFYSFGVLFDLMCEDTDRAEALLQHALNTSEKLIHTPAVLVPYYKRQIKKNFDKTDTQKLLLQLLDMSCSARDIRDSYWNLISYVLGNSYNDIVATFSNDHFDANPKKMPRQQIIRKETQETFREMYQQVTGDPYLIHLFGHSSIENFGEKIVDGNGYGEWWDREISPTGKDELVLYTNNNEVKRDDYLYTIIHETYPGHGHFYNYVRADNDLMDHGAMMLVEGWATYCEWNTYPSKYVDSIRHNALMFLNNSFYLVSDERARLTYERKRRQGKKLPQFVSSIIYATQYIGYLESYYLGALWLEKAISEKYETPVEFLSMLSKSDKGEFLRLWL